MASTVTMLRAGCLMQQHQRPLAAAAVAAVALPAVRPSAPLVARRPQRRSMGVVVREVTKKNPSTSSINAGPSATAVATARAASRVPVWLIPDISQLDATAAAAAWAVAQDIPLPSLYARAGAEIGIAFLLAGLGVKILGKLAVESMKVSTKIGIRKKGDRVMQSGGRDEGQNSNAFSSIETSQRSWSEAFSLFLSRSLNPPRSTSSLSSKHIHTHAHTHTHTHAHAHTSASTPRQKRPPPPCPRSASPLTQRLAPPCLRPASSSPQLRSRRP